MSLAYTSKRNKIGTTDGDIQSARENDGVRAHTFRKPAEKSPAEIVSAKHGRKTETNMEAHERASFNKRGDGKKIRVVRTTAQRG